MVFVDYDEYIQSPEWKAKEKEFVEQIRECQLCGSDKRLGAHHKDYSNLGNETLFDVLVVCWDCHTKIIHYGKTKGKLRIPLKKEMALWEREALWREIQPTLKFDKEEEIVLPKPRFKVKMRDYKKEVYYDKGKFKPYSLITWLRKINTILKKLIKKHKG